MDLCGPSIPKVLRLQDEKIHQTSNGYGFYCGVFHVIYWFSWLPVYFENDKRFSVMSIAFLLPNPDDSVVWRGPKKNCKVV